MIACALFALHVGYYYEAKESVYKVPQLLAIKGAAKQDYPAIHYAFKLPEGWNRARAEIAAKEDCDDHAIPN